MRLRGPFDQLPLLLHRHVVEELSGPLGERKALVRLHNRQRFLRFAATARLDRPT